MFNKDKTKKKKKKLNKKNVLSIVGLVRNMYVLILKREKRFITQQNLRI